MICCDCHKDKPPELFPSGQQLKKLRRDRCWPCDRIWRNGMWAARYSTPKGRAKWMLQSAKARARKASVPFSLTVEWALFRLEAGVCEATGIAFDFSTERDDVTEWARPLAPSVERKDPRGGYTPENCEIIVWLLNRAKANFDRDVFDHVMREYLQRRK